MELWVQTLVLKKNQHKRRKIVDLFGLLVSEVSVHGQWSLCFWSDRRLNIILLSASWVARITGMSHWHQAWGLYLTLSPFPPAPASVRPWAQTPVTPKKKKKKREKRERYRPQGHTPKDLLPSNRYHFLTFYHLPVTHQTMNSSMD
jgi:hypothetical protein